MSTINTEQIDKINEQLSGITNVLDDYMNVIQKEIIDQSTVKAQQILDEKFEVVSEQITQKLEPIRNNIVEIFSSQYQMAMQKIAPVKAILDMLPISADLSAVVQVLTSVIELITAPYQPIIEFVTEIIPKVMLLSANIQKIVNYQPSLTLPTGVTIPSLNINVAPIKASDITG